MAISEPLLAIHTSFFFFWKEVFFLPALIKYLPFFPVSSLMWGGFSLLVVEQNGHKFLVISVNLLALLAGNNWEECMSASAPAQLCVPTGRAVRRCWAARPPCHRVLVLYKAWQQLGFSSIETSFQHGGLSAGRGAMGAVRAQWMPGQQVRSFIPGFNADNKTKQKKRERRKKWQFCPLMTATLGTKLLIRGMQMLWFCALCRSEDLVNTLLRIHQTEQATLSLVSFY